LIPKIQELLHENDFNIEDNNQISDKD